MPLAQWLHELHERLPVDICREIRAMVWEPLTDETLPSAVASWSDPRTVRQTLQRFGLIELWDVRHVTNMDRLFLDRKHFSADLSRWDTRHVRSMVQTFHGASSFNGPPRQVERWSGDRYARYVRWLPVVQSAVGPLGCLAGAMHATAVREL